MERRLAAILSIDVAGYARLMGRDEIRTLAALKAHRAELIDPQAARHGGKTVKLMGDGALMEFASAVDAVRFAVAVQCAMRGRNANEPEVQRIAFRIGINIGDVIAEDGDIHGDGVNVAARLEGLAEPGGICIRRNVRNQVRDKLALDFEDLGEVEVKNIERPIRVFQVVLNDKAEVLSATSDQPTSRRQSRRVVLNAVGIALLVLLVAGIVWWQYRKPSFEPASVAAMAFPLPDKPSIAVLPFDNYTGEPDQQHIADGITETLTSTLSKIPDLFVIARNSAAAYEGGAVNVQQVAEELGIRYVLEGSVQQAGGRLRVTVQLIDALAGNHLWTESYDRSVEDLFDLQDEIALRTAIELQVKLTTGEEARVLSRTTDDVRAWTLYQQALSNFFKFSKEGNHEARRLASMALAQDAGFADAIIIIGFTHLVDARQGYTTSSENSLRLAVEHAEEARAIAPEAPNLYNLMQSIHRYRGEFDEAIIAGERAVELSPNSEISLLATTMTTHLAGKFDRSIEIAEKAIRQSPHHRSTGLLWLGRSLWFEGDYPRAKEVAREGVERAESETIAALHLLNLAAAQVETGELNEARFAVFKALQKQPRLSLSYLRSAAEYRNDSDWSRFASALRTAGLTN